MNQSTSSSILDIIKRLMAPDVFGPLVMAVGAFIFVAGIIICIASLVKAAAISDNRSQSGYGSVIASFIIGITIMYTGGQLMNSGPDFAKVKLFGVGWETDYMSSSVTQIQPTLSSGIIDYTAVKAIVTFVSFIGMMAVVRGLFLANRWAGGDQQSAAPALVFFLAGLPASNFGALIMVLEDTFRWGLFS